MPKFEKGAVFFYPHNLYIHIIFLRKSWIRIVALSSAHLYRRNAILLLLPQLFCNSLLHNFFHCLPPTMLNVEYIYITYIANCNRINSVWVQCDNTAAKLFIGLLYKCNKFQKNCPKTTWKCCYIFLETKKNCITCTSKFMSRQGMNRTIL